MTVTKLSNLQSVVQSAECGRAVSYIKIVDNLGSDLVYKSMISCLSKHGVSSCQQYTVALQC